MDKGKEVQSVSFELGVESDVQVGTAPIDLQEALELYVRMRRNNIKSDVYTYCSIFNATADFKYLHFGKEVHGMVLKSSRDMMVISVCNATVDAYAKCGAPEYRKKSFYEMEERDMVSWTTLMREEGFRPNQFTFSSVLVSYSRLCFLEYGQQIHGLLCKVGLDKDKCIKNALVDIYAKCGSVNEAKKVFERIFEWISNPDTVSWTAMISGYAQHGLRGCRSTL
ncbi:hypothetical protein Pint_18021 [Pistacia integerrima]|uniref:Uncharacterized protein n=1 Tax=Pistacia integerrima TaxID=434235 RepID=A0ACC0Z1E2_9ROSI|nr:hypothetical protein Pint_18021 [Pistacia integerrima]